MCRLITVRDNPYVITDGHKQTKRRLSFIPLAFVISMYFGPLCISLPRVPLHIHWRCPGCTIWHTIHGLFAHNVKWHNLFQYFNLYTVVAALSITRPSTLIEIDIRHAFISICCNSLGFVFYSKSLNIRIKCSCLVLIDSLRPSF